MANATIADDGNGFATACFPGDSTSYAVTGNSSDGISGADDRLEIRFTADDGIIWRIFVEAYPDGGFVVSPQEKVTAETRVHKMPYCTECEMEHDFPVQRFTPGDRVTIIETGIGYWHRDKVGQTFTVQGVMRFLTMPCDEVSYRLVELSEGSILESRLIPAAESRTTQPSIV